MGQVTLVLFVIVLVVLCSGQQPPPAPIPLPPELIPNGYCRSTVTPPENPFFNCSSCQNRCDELRNFYIHKYCSCDSSCMAYGDCCIDFEQSCPAQFAASSSLRQHFKYRRTECYTVRTVPPSTKSIVGLGSIVPYFRKYNFVAVCGHTGETCNRTYPAEILKPNLAIPVTDSETGVNYVNYKCAQCNNVSKITPWIPQLACNPTIVPYQNGTFEIDTEQKLELYLTGCEVNYIIPSNVRERRFCGFTRKCPSTCSNSDLINRCENSYISDYVHSNSGRFKIYDNFYCALCGGEIAVSLTCAQVEYFDRLPAGRAKLFSLSLLFDFDPSEGVTVGRKACSLGQKWEPSSQECRQVFCPGDLRLVNETCLPATLNMALSASLYFNVTQDLDKVMSNLDNDDFVLGNVAEQLKQLLLVEDRIVDMMLNRTQISDHILNITLGINLLFSKNSTFNFGSDLNNFSGSVISVFRDELLLLVQQSNINLGNVIITLDENVSFKQSLLTDCTWFSFSKDKFELRNDTLVIKSTKKEYTTERYRLVKMEALVCILNEEINDVKLIISSEALGILTIVLMSLSIICLIIRLVLQFKIPYFNSFAGKLHFNLCLALCLAFLMLLVGGVTAVYEVREACKVFATLTYWFFLAAFVWMTAVTIDTWLVFRPSATFVKVDNTNKSLARYVLPCWLLPALITATVTGLDFSSIDQRFQPQFGTYLCWFNRRYALLVYFGGPVAFLTLLTTMFFIMTVLHLRKTINSAVRPSSQRESHQIWIYLRLFILMGICWIFCFVAAFVGHDALWIIFIILNASQGILIFISFVLQRPVLKEIGKIRKRPAQSGTAMTTSTGLSSSGASSHIYTAGKQTSMNATAI